MLEQDASVFLVDANGVLDSPDGPVSSRELGIEVLDASLAVAAQRQAVGHVSGTVLAEIERMLSLMGELGVSVGDHHLGKGQAVEDVAWCALLNVLDVVEHDTFTVIEADVEPPVLPLNLPTLELEGHALGLGDVDGLQVGSESSRLRNTGRVVVDGVAKIGERPADLGDIDGDNLLLVGIEHGAEVERVLVLAVVHVGAVVHEGLL